MENQSTNCRQLLEYYVRATECQLATLEQLKMRKGTPKCDLRRQTSIVNEMVVVCRVFGAAATSQFRKCPRLQELLDATEPP